jgi:P4 family phage/plasmid primase-like protien
MAHDPSIPHDAHEEKSASSDVLTFLRWLYGDDAPGWLTIWTLPDKATGWYPAHKLRHAAAYALNRADTHNVYFGLGLRQEQIEEGRGESDDVLGIPGLWIEVDIKHFVHTKVNLPESIEEALALVLEALPLQPSLMILSGYGIHIYWLFRELWIFEDANDRQEAYHLLRRLQATIQAVAKLHSWEVDSTFDLARVLRIPGTYNRNVPDDPKRVEIIEADPDRRYNPSDFHEHLIDVDETTYQQTTSETYAGDLTSIELHTLKIPTWLKTLIRYGEDVNAEKPYPSRSEALFDAVQGLIKAGVDDITIMSIMVDPRYAVSEKPREKGRKWLASEIDRAHAKLNGHRSTATSTPEPDTSDAAPEESHASSNSDEQPNSQESPPRDQPSPKAFFLKKTFIPKRLGDYLLSQYHIKYAAGMLWVYRNGVYVPEGERILAAAAQQFLGEERRQNRIEETLRYIEVATYTEMPPADLRYINLLNGRLEWATGTLHAHTPDVFSVMQLPVSYDPDALCPTCDHYFQTTLDEDVIPLVEEVMGDHLIPDTRYEKATMLTGEGENGKSVFIDMLTALLGSQHVSNVALQDLEENRFRVAELFGKLGNFFADLDPRALKSSSLFKALVTGDEIEAERKFQQPFKFRNVARLLFSANKLPPSSDRTHAFYRRWHVIPFTRTFTAETRDTELREKLIQELPGLLNRALQGLCRLAAQKRFTEPQAVKDALSAYERQNDTVAAFFDEAVETNDKGYIGKQRFYKTYRGWCDLQKLRPVTQKELKTRLYHLCSTLDEARIETNGTRGGKGPWHWIGIRLIDDEDE